MTGQILLQLEQLNEEGTTLWPNLKVLTSVLLHEDDLRNPEVIICAGASFADDWRSMDLESYELLQPICILEQMPAGKRLISWPEDGFFTIEYPPTSRVSLCFSDIFNARDANKVITSQFAMNSLSFSQQHLAIRQRKYQQILIHGK